MDEEEFQEAMISQIKTLNDTVSRLDTAIRGNGQLGISTRLAVLENSAATRRWHKGHMVSLLSLVVAALALFAAFQ